VEEIVKTNKLSLLAFALALGGCVSGAPQLTPDQQSRLEKISDYKVGEKPSKEYKVLEEISAADCSGAPAGGRIWGNAEQAIGTLKRKAVVINADAVVNVTCGVVPLLNNCWAAQKCSGQAVVFQ
jgi:hypothetical protein